MKTYPSIPGMQTEFLGKPCIAFNKLDGSNIRVEWSLKKGWYKFGTRKTMFNLSTPFWGKVIEVFHEQLASQIESVLRTEKPYKGIKNAVVFAEYLGPNSFAGQHSDSDPMKLILFDVNILKKGFVSPDEFVRDFGHLDNAAEVVHQGILCQEFIQAVKRGDYPLQEGVVCKGGSGHKLWMTKIKTDKWISQVKSMHPTNWQLFHDLKDEF